MQRDSEAPDKRVAAGSRGAALTTADANPRRTALKMGVSALLVAVLLLRVDLSAVAESLLRLRPAVAALSLVLYASGQLVSSVRWQTVLRYAGFYLPLHRVVAIYFGAMFFNLFAPSTLGGDSARVMALLRSARPGGAGPGDNRVGLAVSTVMFDRICGLSILFAVAAAGVAIFGRFGWPRSAGPAALMLWAACVAGPLLLAGPLGQAAWMPNALSSRLSGPAAGLWRSPGLWLRCSLLSAILHLHQIAIAILLLGAFEIAVPWQSAFVFHPLVMSSAAVPVGFFGIGVREVGFVFALSTFQGVPEAQALSFGLAWSALLVAASLFGGVFVVLGALKRDDGSGEK